MTLLIKAGQLTVAFVVVATVPACGGAGAEPIGPSVPNVLGQPLDRAKIMLQDVGFTGQSEDLLRGRSQIVDNNWTVCVQNPGTGPAEEGSTVALGVVKDSETCPGSVATSAAPTTSAQPTTQAPRTTPKAAPKPAPRPVPKPAPDPQPKDDSEPADPAPADDGRDERGDSGGGGSVGTVNPGSFCDPPGAGVSKTGKPMVCAPGSDGRNRWRGA